MSRLPTCPSVSCESDDRVFYFYYNKKGKGGRATSEDYFHVAVFNGSTMALEKDFVNTEANEMAGSAYGELLQQTTFFDEQGNLYLAAFDNVDKKEMGKLLRIKKGATDFEKGYNGFANSDGKLLTVQYLGNGKVFTYSRNDNVTEDDGKGGTKIANAIDSYSHYYSVVDLNTKTRTRMQFGGRDIDYSSGRFAQRSAFVAKENKVYFGVNTASAQPCVYIYDVATGRVEGYPTLQTLIARLKQQHAKTVTLVPLLFVAGNHVANDISVEWREALEREGFSVRLCIEGLGEVPEIQELYMSRPPLL